jgi:hypothetical protein
MNWPKPIGTLAVANPVLQGFNQRCQTRPHPPPIVAVLGSTRPDGLSQDYVMTFRRNEVRMWNSL